MCSKVSKPFAAVHQSSEMTFVTALSDLPFSYSQLSPCSLIFNNNLAS